MTRRRELLWKIITPLLVFALAELAFRFFDVPMRMSIAERKTFAAYQGMPWAAQYFKDLADCAAQSRRHHQPRYSRYVLQDINEDCSTPTVNYANRIRKTRTPPDAPAGARVYEVAMFGGSTMEGQGAIDDETIASWFSTLANAAPGEAIYHVTNYGVGGYTFTQGVVKLITLLREGRHFDDVIFYDGDNDVDYAYNLNEPGALEEEDLVRARLEGSLWDRLAQFGKTQLNHCVLCMGGVMLARNTPFIKDHVTPYFVKVRDAIHFKKGVASNEDVAPFAQQIADYYVQSHQLLARVAEAYHLRYLDVWQPSLMYETGYAPGEAMLARIDTRLTDARLRQLYTLSRDRTVAARLDNFLDLSHVLEGRSKAVYLDAVHLSGEGNRIVASRIFEAWKQPPGAQTAGLRINRYPHAGQ
jgi:lysophospholipase L1-like esterase